MIITNIQLPDFRQRASQTNQDQFLKLIDGKPLMITQELRDQLYKMVTHPALDAVIYGRRSEYVSANSTEVSFSTKTGLRTLHDVFNKVNCKFTRITEFKADKTKNARQNREDLLELCIKKICEVPEHYLVQLFREGSTAEGYLLTHQDNAVGAVRD